MIKPEKQRRSLLKPIMLIIEDVVEVTGLSESSIRTLVNNNDFPKPRQASDRSARWLLREIEEWAEARPVSKFLPPPKTSEGGKNGKPSARKTETRVHANVQTA